jgi:hypothetical protein
MAGQVRSRPALLERSRSTASALTSAVKCFDKCSEVHSLPGTSEEMLVTKYTPWAVLDTLNQQEIHEWFFVVAFVQNKLTDIISLTPNGFPWAANGKPMPTATAASMLGMLWSAEDAAAEAVAAAAGLSGVRRLSDPVRDRMHCWGLQMVSRCAVLLSGVMCRAVWKQSFSNHTCAHPV